MQGGDASTYWPQERSMKWIVFVVLLLLVGGAIGVSVFPMSLAADFATKHDGAFKYAGATGSVWNGKLQGVVLNGEPLGDVAIRLDAGKLFVGQAAADIGFTRKELTGQGRLSKALFGGRMKLADIKVAGDVSAAPVLPVRIRAAPGKFSLVVSEILFDKNVCKAANGEVWTDALAKADLGHQWVGPELRGPVSCRNGKLAVDASGKAVTGEEVTASIGTGPDLSLDLEAKVLNATQGAAETLSELGFRPDGTAYVLHQQLGKSGGVAPDPTAAKPG
jgi:general secretion pathway protein N